MADEKKSQGRDAVDALAEDAKRENPDDQTRRETFELDLMEAHRSGEGASVELENEDEDEDGPAER